MPKPKRAANGNYRWPHEDVARHSRPFGAKYRDDKPATHSGGGSGSGVSKEIKARNKWRRTPIVTGSSLTNWDVKKAGKAAAHLQYGGKIRAEKQDINQAHQYRSDIGSYYDDYLKQLAAHSHQAQQFGAAASNQITGLQQGVTGLSTADLTGMQGQANQDAAARGTTAGDTSQMASNATAIRQALVGTFAGQQAGVNAARNNYASSLAHVVGPGQKLQAQAQALGNERKARQALTDTRGDVGAFKQKYKTETRASEAKNVLAGQIAGLGAATKAATLHETHRSHVADERAARARIKAASKAATRAAQAKGQHVNAYGYTDAQWQRFTPAHRQRIMKALKSTGKSTGKDSSSRGDRPSLNTNQRNKGVSEAAGLLTYAIKAKNGQPFIPGHKPQPKLNRSQALQKLRENVDVPSSEAIYSAVLDATFVGHLSQYTVDKLKRAGFSALDIADAVGVPTRRQWDKRVRQSHHGPMSR